MRGVKMSEQGPSQTKAMRPRRFDPVAFDALLMVSDDLTFLNRRRVYEFAAEHRLPATYERAIHVRDGGLSSLSPDLDEIYDRATDQIDQILKGAKPADPTIRATYAFPRQHQSQDC